MSAIGILGPTLYLRSIQLPDFNSGDFALGLLLRDRMTLVVKAPTLAEANFNLDLSALKVRL